MGGKIDAYVDCVSPYSYFAFLYLRKQRELLAAHGVEVEFHPMFLGGVVVGTGNKPPWTLPAKAKYLEFDRKRASQYFGVPFSKTPPFFPILSILPQRCMVFVKQRYSREQYEEAFITLWKYVFEQHIDISKLENMAKALSEQFADTEVEDILEAASRPHYKQALAANTQRAIELGAFGAPFFWVRNEDGQEEPFFGSDRFHFLWEYLGIPWMDLAIQQKAKL